MELSEVILHLIGYLTEEQWLDAKKQLPKRHHDTHNYHDELSEVAKECDKRYCTKMYELINTEEK